MEANWPKTVDEAVELLVRRLDESQIDALKSVPASRRIMFHSTLGKWVRNSFGLWAGNADLIRDTGESHPDDASWVILDRLFQRIAS